MWNTTETRAPAGVWIKSDAGEWINPEYRLVFDIVSEPGVLTICFFDDKIATFTVSNPTQLSRFCEWLVQTGMSEAEAMEAVGLSAASLAEVERLQMPTDEEIAAELEPPADYDDQVARVLKADDDDDYDYAADDQNFDAARERGMGR